MIDYWLSKLFFDLSSSPAAAAEYRADRLKVLDRYPLRPDVRAAIVADNVSALAPLTNPYLLRYYFSLSGMSDEAFIRGLNEAPAASRNGHG